MARTTKKDIRQVETVINGQLERSGYDWRVFVEWAYGQPRAYRQPVGETYVNDLSPRLPMGEMYQWLSAFHAGLVYGLDKPAAPGPFVLDPDPIISTTGCTWYVFRDADGKHFAQSADRERSRMIVNALNREV